MCRFYISVNSGYFLIGQKYVLKESRRKNSDRPKLKRLKKPSDSSMSRGLVPTSMDGESSSLIGYSLRVLTRSGKRTSTETGTNEPAATATGTATAASCNGTMMSMNRETADLFSNATTSADYVLRNSVSTLASHSLTRRRQGQHAGWTGVTIKSSRAINERKALKVLIIIFSIFVVFWSPFFVINLISVYCTNCQFITKELILAITWLGYASSTLNPVIYTMFNKSFRSAFVNLLRCRTIPTRKSERFLIYRNVYESTRSNKRL